MVVAAAAPVISGTGISQIGRRSGIPAVDLTVQAATAALADAGLTAADIDGVITLGDTPAAEAAESLGISAPGDFGRSLGSSGLLTPVVQAYEAIREGRARHVLVYRTVQMMGGTVDREAAPGPKPNGEMLKFDYLIAAHAYSAVNWLAMHCRRHMDVYGTTREQLGWVAINARRNAARNPLAVYRDPITMDDYLAARPISSPLGLYDCDVPVDGSIAVVVSHRDYAPDCPSPVGIEAIGGAYGTGGWFHRDDFPNMASVEAAAQMWSRTELKPNDLDVAELYDGFTFLTIAWLEALGICGNGEAGPFVEGASRIALDGELPLNTYGGQLSAGRMHGYWVLHEACLQLRGQAGDRQLQRRPETAVVAAGGGPIAGCMLLTG